MPAVRTVSTLDDAPARGEYCGESLLGNRKADLILRPWDRRVMPIECKVSNSAINSVKRLNNDAAVKAVAWRHDFGDRQVVPAAVLSGVYAQPEGCAGPRTDAVLGARPGRAAGLGALDERVTYTWALGSKPITEATPVVGDTPRRAEPRRRRALP